MGDTEEYFPRGGKKPTTTYFKQSANFLGAPEKGERKKKKPKKKVEGDDGYLSDEETKQIDQSFKNCAFGLSYKTIKEGLLILGRVKTILETKIIISLPCRMIGSVMACHVSEPYNKLLEAYVNDKTDKVLELGQMFRLGQYVAVKVLEVKELSIMLSTMPQHVNCQKTNAELHKGTLLQAAVSSIEDHGYVMDIGVPNIRAFLPKSNTNPEIELDVGMVSWCCIKSLSSDIVTLSNELVALQNSWQRQKTSSPLLPGSSIDFLVETPLDNGIEGTIFGDVTAYIQRQHADSVKGKKPSLGQKIRARLLYVMPTRNTPFLTMKHIFESTYPDLAVEQTLRDGQIIEEAQVLKITGRSIHFRLGGGCYGTMSLKRIQVNEDLSDEEVVAKSYPLGSCHKVRVLCYNLSDYVYSVTDQPDVVSERYFSLEQLSPGQLVDATVKNVADNHVLLSVGRVTGYVPQAHLYDSGIVTDVKKTSTLKLPKKKFREGQSVRARVLSVDASRQTLFLTLKPSLLTPDLPLLTSYEHVDIGKAYTGVIKTVRDFVVVSFFNNVHAFVPRQYVTKDALDDIAQAFHVGQIVNCTILRVDPEARKMTGSLTTLPFWPAKKREFPDKRKRDPVNVVPNKKSKMEAPEEIKQKDKKKQKKMDTTSESDSEQENIKGKKRKNEAQAEKTEILNAEDEVVHKKVKKKITKSSQQETQNLEIDPVDKKRKNKAQAEQTETIDADDEFVNKTDKKKKTKKSKQETENLTEQINQEKELKTKDKKKKRKDSEETKLSEDSDAIETDLYEDGDEVLTPQDLALIDMSDCTTPKQYKKRVVSLLKSINNRTKRITKIEKKLAKFEKNGLSPENKMFHTAMHAEMIVLQERITKLLEALKVGQEKLKEFGIEDKTDFKKEKDVKEKEKVKKGKVEMELVGDLKPVLEVPSAKEFWSATDSLSRSVQDEDSSSSDDEDKEQPKKKRKKLTVAEKVAKAREEEERLREMEIRAIESESQPRSSEQFERALLANPNSSQLWIAYMAFHLQATEVDKARAVFRKALNTISFREESEKLNVWLAVLNLENRFGTKESQQKILEEALQMNEPYAVHSKLLDIYVDTGKQQELVALVDLMLRKYRRQAAVYPLCGAACFKLGLVDKARQVMQKGIAVLDKKEHVSVLVQFAQLERSGGARERAEALLEQVLAVYPQRVDVAQVYTHMLLKDNDVQQLRQVMERMTSQKLPARKMKILYKNWIEAEEKIGDQEQIERIKQRAMEYIQKAKF